MPTSDVLDLALTFTGFGAQSRYVAPETDKAITAGMMYDSIANVHPDPIDGRRCVTVTFDRFSLDYGGTGQESEDSRKQIATTYQISIDDSTGTLLRIAARSDNSSNHCRARVYNPDDGPQSFWGGVRELAPEGRVPAISFSRALEIGIFLEPAVARELTAYLVIWQGLNRSKPTLCWISETRCLLPRNSSVENVIKSALMVIDATSGEPLKTQHPRRERIRSE